jgi:hypothetical protein
MNEALLDELREGHPLSAATFPKSARLADHDQLIAANVVEPTAVVLRSSGMLCLAPNRFLHRGSRHHPI